jgi:3-oxoacyl-[acyl-carrier-protein] synthase III
MRTRSKNATAHPGIAAMDALRTRRAPRNPELIQKEKNSKQARKEEKAAAKALKVAGEKYVEQLDAVAAATSNSDQIPRHRVQKGQKKRQHTPSPFVTVSH